MLARAVEQANEALADADLAALPAGLTPHSLRRTFASLLFALGRTAPEVMGQLGHTDPKLALRILRAGDAEASDGQQLRRVAGVERDVLDEGMRGATQAVSRV